MNEEKVFDFAVVGVTFENRQEYLQELYSDMVSNNIKSFTVDLIPEPENPYDPNAIAVVLKNGNNIGYVSKDFNEEIKEILDKITYSEIIQIYMNKKRIFNAMVRIKY